MYNYSVYSCCMIWWDCEAAVILVCYHDSTGLFIKENAEKNGSFEECICDLKSIQILGSVRNMQNLKF